MTRFSRCRFSGHRLSTPLAFGLLLAALMLRGLIPSGYMPSSEQPFALELCQVGLPAGVQHVHDHSGAGGPSQAADSSLCVFGLAPGGAPAPQQPALSMPIFAVATPAAKPALSVAQARQHSPRQPRAPPAFS